MLLLVFKALTGEAPAYICDLLTPHEPEHCLRFSNKAILSILKSWLVTRGDQAFAVRAPYLWNSLPGNLRQANIVSFFKPALKIYFYQMSLF